MTNESMTTLPVEELVAIEARLRAGLEGVTPGPWSVLEYDGLLKQTDLRTTDHKTVIQVPWDRGTGCSAHRDANYFALLSPENIRALLDAIALLREERDQAAKENRNLSDELDNLEQEGCQVDDEIRQLTARAEASEATANTLRDRVGELEKRLHRLANTAEAFVLHFNLNEMAEGPSRQGQHTLEQVRFARNESGK